VLTITPGSTSSGGARTGAGNATTLTADDATAISDSVHAIWSFFGQYGGTATFGEPISREFTLSGLPRQLLISRTLFPEGTSPVGSVIRIRNVSFTVVGVLPTCWIPPRQT
jgi:hypothetical protein